MNDNWLEIVETLQPYIKGNSSETKYQQEIENCLKFLGWRSSNKTMQSQVMIPIGNKNSIRPDIVLYKLESPVLPIEIKRPGNTCNGKQENQLMSYMRQLKLNVGLYIGENIQLYYDNPTDHDNPIKVLIAEFRNTDANGAVLCNMLDYEHFDTDELEDFCKERYNQIIARNNLQQRLSEFFSSDNAVKNVTLLIKDKFVKEGYDKDVLDDEFCRLSLDVNWKNEIGKIRTDSVSPLKNAITKQIGNKESADKSISLEEIDKKKVATKIKLTLKDGTIIMKSEATSTLKYFVEHIGVDKVASLNLHGRKNIPLISKEKSEEYGKYQHPIAGGYFILLNHSTAKLKEIIEQIAIKLDVIVQVEILAK